MDKKQKLVDIGILIECTSEAKVDAAEDEHEGWEDVGFWEGWGVLVEGRGSPVTSNPSRSCFCHL